MNRLAVVLAADSATTVRRQTENGKEERYFKGANKIFQLSNFAPVGLMIFDSASILRVPWEVVIKAFRRELAHKVFDHLDGYADEFFQFLETHPHLFPQELQSAEFLAAAAAAGARLLFRQDKADDEETRRASVDAAIEAAVEKIDNEGLHSCFDESFVNAQIGASQNELRTRFDSAISALSLVGPTSMDALIAVAVKTVMHSPGEFMGTTGLVFAGFGENEFFPRMLEHTSHGMVSGKHVSVKTSAQAIDHEVPAWLSAFAQTSMSDTFSRGLSRDVFVTVMEAVGDGLEGFATSISTALGTHSSEIKDLDDLLSAARSDISDKVLGKTGSDHALPLRRVLGFLPVEEMTELAETLINLQSLKEKVTMPSETVGGPVDVAVITKSEGLVWIKRKHFFDPSLNSRYTLRQRDEMN